MTDTEAGYFVIFRRLTLRGQRYFFRAVAANHEVVAQSEAYTSRAAAFNGIRALRHVAANSSLLVE